MYVCMYANPFDRANITSTCPVQQGDQIPRYHTIQCPYPFSRVRVLRSAEDVPGPFRLVLQDPAFQLAGGN